MTEGSSSVLLQQVAGEVAVGTSSAMAPRRTQLLRSLGLAALATTSLFIGFRAWKHYCSSKRAGSLSEKDKNSARSDNCSAGQPSTASPTTPPRPATTGSDQAHSLHASPNAATAGAAMQVSSSPASIVVDTPERRHAIELYQALKTKGNASFQRGDHDAALQEYQDAVDVLAAIPGGEKDEEVTHLSQVVRANGILVFLKLDRHDEARMLATFILQDDFPVPVVLRCKVLFRRAQAMVKLGDLAGAVGDLKAAQHFSPTPDAVIDDELRRVEKLLAAASTA